MKSIECINSINILIGQNVKDNDQLLKLYGHTDYIWLHLKAYPSSHVVILDNNPSYEIIELAAKACRDNTKYRSIKNLKVSYTKYNNVQKTTIPGAVNFKSNKKVLEIKL
jgi:predicted ribosome quality control (RQC) complex YloA/Tae2 family protein